MKQFSSFRSTVFIITLLIVVFSCKKEKEILKQTQNVSSNNLRLEYSNWPTVTDGRLVFADEDDFYDYLNFLDSVILDTIDVPPPDTPISDPDDILTLVENSLTGFTSLRSIAQEEFDVLNETGWDNIEDIPSVHWIPSITIRSILNEDREVVIGNKLFKYINEDWGLEVDMDAPASVFDAVINFNEATDIGDIIDGVLGVDYNGYVTLYDFKNGANVVAGDFTTLGLSDGTFFIGEFAPKVQNECGGTIEVKLENIFTGYVQSDPPYSTVCSALYAINWDDGSSIQYVASSSGLNDAYLNVSHNYANPGLYNIEIAAEAIYPVSSNGGVSYRDKQVDVRQGNCLYGYGRTSSKPRHTSGNLGWEGSVYILQNKFWLGTNRKIGSETIRYRKKNNGKWVKDKGSVATSWVCEMRGQGCTTEPNRYGSSNPGNSKTACAETSVGAEFGWHKITSTHSIYDGSNTQSFTIVLNACD